MMFGFPFSRRERLRRRASAWFVRLQNDPSDHDEQQFRRWIEESPDHEAAFARVQKSYASAGLLAASQIYRLDTPIEKQIERQRTAYALRKPAFVAATAAALIATIAGAVILLGNSPRAEAVQQRMLISTGIGEVRTVALADGTRVTADASTVAEVNLGPDTRAIALRRGRVRIEGAMDSRPLLVTAGVSRIILPEGALDVAVAADGTRVRLLPGSNTLELSRDGDAQERIGIGPGQVLLIPPGGEETRSTPASRNDLQWPTGRLEFDHAPLAAVVEEANRQNPTLIRLEGHGIETLRVTGVFRAGDPVGLARSLATAFNLEVEQRHNLLVLRRLE